MKNSLRIIMFTLIILVCIFTVIYVIYSQFFVGSVDNTQHLDQDTQEEQKRELIENSFDKIFNNKLDNQGNEINITGVTKLNSNEDLVYTWVNKKKSVDNSYELDLNIPRINISNTSVEKFNNSIKEIYVQKANEIILNANKNNNTTNISGSTNTLTNTISDINQYNNFIGNNVNNINNNASNIETSNSTIYTVEYASYINTNILSLVIKSTLKEGDTPQRVIIQTYNYNLSTNEEITLSQVLEIKGLNLKIVNDDIKAKVEKANSRAESLANLGYNAYKRDLTSSIYDVQNVNNYILGPDNHLYIIYAYGNSNFTDEMDIIAFI